MLTALALVAYTISVLGLSALWDPEVWWQSILVWFLGAIIAHDLVLFPLYALADRLTQRGLHVRSATDTTSQPWRGVEPLNYIRIPVIAVGLLFLLFFPGILQQGADTYQAATGQTQEPFLERWLLLSAAIMALSAAAYAARILSTPRASTSSAPPPQAQS
jgi:succinate dehydrogenase hydrophobic anchor subunit